MRVPHPLLLPQLIIPTSPKWNTTSIIPQAFLSPDLDFLEKSCKQKLQTNPPSYAQSLKIPPLLHNSKKTKEA